MPTVKTYKVVGGKAKIQIEDLLGKNPGGGWVYQGPGTGNKNAEGAHYYYKSQMGQGSVKKAGGAGQFSLKIDVAEAGTYSILLRAARDTNKPGDSRNDIWIKVDGNTQSVMPKGTPQLTSGGNGFVKFKGAQTSWINAHMFSTSKHGDTNPASNVVLDKGMHTITFAPRSIGFHIDSLQVVKKGVSAKANDKATVAENDSKDDNKTPVKEASKDDKKDAAKHDDKKDAKHDDQKHDPKVDAKHDDQKNGDQKNGDQKHDAAEHGVKVAAISHASDDFESNKAAGSKDLEFGRDGDGAQSVGLRFTDVKVDKDAEIKDAHFVFKAVETSKGGAHFTIELEDDFDARTYSRGNAPDDRHYLDHDVEWNVASWKAGQTYKSADVSDLIKEAIKEGGNDALDTLAFRISGSGERVAEAFEAPGHDGPQLVIDYV